jgi:hypothetical protein
VPTELDLKLRVEELLRALAFVHNNSKSAHLSVNIENIYISINGNRWKLGGF